MFFFVKQIFTAQIDSFDEVHIQEKGFIHFYVLLLTYVNPMFSTVPMW